MILDFFIPTPKESKFVGRAYSKVAILLTIKTQHSACLKSDRRMPLWRAYLPSQDKYAGVINALREGDNNAQRELSPIRSNAAHAQAETSAQYKFRWANCGRHHSSSQAHPTLLRKRRSDCGMKSPSLKSGCFHPTTLLFCLPMLDAQGRDNQFCMLVLESHSNRRPSADLLRRWALQHSPPNVRWWRESHPVWWAGMGAMS